MVRVLETDSVIRSSVALCCEPQTTGSTTGSTTSVRTAVLTSDQAVKEDKAIASDLQETLSEDAV